MSREEENEALFQSELRTMEILAGLQHALDQHYRRLREAARVDWERLFGCKDPADACVTVRVTPEQLAVQARAARGSGFLKSRRPRENNPGAKHASPGFAH